MAKTESEIAKALHRLADAQFQTAKALNRKNKIETEQLEISKEMCDMQRANYRVTQHLEAELAAQSAARRGEYPAN